MIRNKKLMIFNLEDIWFDEECFKESTGNLVSLHSNEVLDRRFYDFCLVQKTFVLDITADEETLLAKMDSKSCRYPIRKANRDGILIKTAESMEEKQKYLEFQNRFCEEKGIPKVDKNELSNLEIFYAENKDGEYLGGCAFLISEDKKTVRYKYGATQHKQNANESILWNAILNYKSKGVSSFDFGGCIPTEDQNSYYYRHFHFKKKWGGELVDSYTYFRTKSIYKILYLGFKLAVNMFFDGDVNGFVVWLNKKNMIG